MSFWERTQDFRCDRLKRSRGREQLEAIQMFSELHSVMRAIETV